MLWGSREVISFRGGNTSKTQLGVKYLKYLKDLMIFHLVHLFELLKSSILATSASNTKIYLFRINANNTEIYLVKFQTSTIATNLISLPRRNKSSVLCNFRIFLYAFT